MILRGIALAAGLGLAGAALCWDGGTPSGAQPVPALKARVTDVTATLSAGERTDLESRLAAWEAKTGNQLAVLMVPTTQPESIEEYGIRVGDAWKIGKKGKDNGALLLIAKNDKRVRIDVGYGLEGNLTDVGSRRIISEVMAPHFKAGRFAEGIAAGIDKIERVAAGDEKLSTGPPPRKSQTASRANDWSHLAVPALIVLVVLGTVLRAVFGRTLGSGVGGALAGGLGWLLTGSVFIAGAAAVIVLILLLLGLGTGRGGGWGGGFGGYGGGGWSGGSGGSWSGGGGSFGGGGASGSWGDGN